MRCQTRSVAHVSAEGLSALGWPVGWSRPPPSTSPSGGRRATHPVPQVGGRCLPVQLGHGVGQVLQVRVEQPCLRPQLVGHHVPVTAQQRPALHVHELWAQGAP